VETIRGTDVPNQPAPRSDAPVATATRQRERLRRKLFRNWGAGRAATAELKATVADPNE